MNGLLNNLIAYWPGDEASGNLLDAHTNELDLTDTNTVTNATGKVYDTARQYTAANSECHTRAGDDALLSTGDVDFTLAAWVYFDSKLATQMDIVGKWLVTDNQREYMLLYYNTTDRLLFLVSKDGSASELIAADNLGSPETEKWYLVVAWHDSVANTLNIQINNGTVDSKAYSLGVKDSTAVFRIGIYSSDGVTYPWNGRIGPTAFWKSTAGGGGVLSTAQRTALYNSGNGLTYAAFTT
jgi:hypothetical protein